MQAIPGYKTENELVTPGSGPTGGQETLVFLGSRSTVKLPGNRTSSQGECANRMFSLRYI